MKDKLKRIIQSLDIMSKLKDAGIFNPATARLIVSAHMKSDPSRENEKLESIITLSQMFMSPFSKPDERVDGIFRFAITENNIPVGINPEECHFLVAGQTGCGKSTLLKILFTQALLHNKGNKNV